MEAGAVRAAHAHRPDQPPSHHRHLGDIRRSAVARRDDSPIANEGRREIRSEPRSSYGMFYAAIRLVQLKVTVSRTAAQAAEQRENTASALPHPDRNFRQI